MTAAVPFLDLGAAYRALQAPIDAAVERVLASGWYIGGPECAAFEQEFAAYCEAAHCVGLGNGLDALYVALLALGVGEGDEVIVPSNTFIATLLAVSRTGARSVLVEPDPRTSNIDPARIESAITTRTRVIIPVHLYGQPADLDSILDIARRYGLRVLEDAAQAHGARFRGQRIGAHGDVVAWSFYPGKNLGALGDAGAVTTDDIDLAARIRMISNYGSSRKYVHEVKGTNSRLDPLQAAILRVKLAHLDDWNDRRRALASSYDAALGDSGVTIPYVPNAAASSWHLYVVHTDRRDAVQAALTAAGIETLVHYPTPPHRQGAYREFADGDYPIADRLAASALSLPIGPHLDPASVTRTAATIAEALAR